LRRAIIDNLDDGRDCREGDSAPSDEADDDATAAGHMSCEMMRKIVHENPGVDRAGLKHSDPQANPLPAVTGRGVARGSDIEHRTRTRVTRDRDTAVSRIPVTNPKQTNLPQTI
jgi:hypothetical protein